MVFRLLGLPVWLIRQTRSPLRQLLPMLLPEIPTCSVPPELYPEFAKAILYVDVDAVNSLVAAQTTEGTRFW
jgi:hypothetical protein